MSFHYIAFSSFTFECKSNPCMKQLPCQIKLANCPVSNTEREKCKFATDKKDFLKSHRSFLCVGQGPQFKQNCA